MCADENFQKTIRVHNITDVNSSVFTDKICFPTMKEQKWGRIISLNSIHGLVASEFKVAYVSINTDWRLNKPLHWKVDHME